MTRYDHRHWFLASGVAAVAGYVDAVGFLTLGGLFVSFMSGNSTRMVVGLVGRLPVAATAALLIGGFVAGVMTGSLLAMAAGVRRKPVLLGLVGVLLTVPAGFGAILPATVSTLVMAFAMGTANAVFQRDGEVSIGVTYMTGTLVKFGQRLAEALTGGPRWKWLPWFGLWAGLIAGAFTGTLAWPRFGLASLWFAVAWIWMLGVCAIMIGPADPGPAVPAQAAFPRCDPRRRRALHMTGSRRRP